jgi:hypothetical protein
MRGLLLLAMVTALFGAPAIATDPCANVPPAAANYLNAHHGWRILRTSDLVRDDQQLWRQYHRGICPGLAEVDFDGSGNKFVALALVRQARGKQWERIVVVRQSPNGLESHTIIPVFESSYVVVWQRPPEIVAQWDSGQRTRILHESLVVEQMEASSRSYYLKDGRFRFVQTSD